MFFKLDNDCHIFLWVPQVNIASDFTEQVFNVTYNVEHFIKSLICCSWLGLVLYQVSILSPSTLQVISFPETLVTLK